MFSEDTLLFADSSSQQKGDLFANFTPTPSNDDLFAAPPQSTASDTSELDKHSDIFSPKGSSQSWKTLIVDDEEDIHEITALVLSTYTFHDKPLELLSAYSAEQAKDILRANEDIALVFLDVVMETDDAGLQLVRYIREQLNNPYVRIILRTGQPGYAPEEKVIIEYEINDYTNKTELSRQKLVTLTTSSLRSYHDIMTIESYRQSLEEKVALRTAELQEKNQELGLLNEKLVRLNQEKNEFLGIASHDLKNPLSGILGLAEEIATNFNECTKEEVIEYAYMIQAGAKQMLNLVVNLLDVNAIESGQNKAILTYVDILPTLLELVKHHGEQAKVKNISLYLNTDQKVCMAFVDKDIIRQIFDNLLSNAIKYSPFDRQVFIRVYEKETRLCCEVQDEGPGISEEEQTKLFKKFTKLTPKPTGDEHSTGLGLFIVKKLLDSIHGEISCRSILGKGTTFTVELLKQTVN